MTEFNGETEKEFQTKVERLKKFTNCLIELDKDFEVKDWDSGEGTDVIIKVKSENEKKEYNLLACFYNSGYFKFEVEEEE